MVFQTENGLVVPAVTAEQMREIDRIAMEVFDLGILQMMENAGRQLQILRAAGLQPADPAEAGQAIGGAKLVVDALIGYSLRGAPRGRAAELIDLCNQHTRRVVSLDVPSGLNATTGETPGQVVRPERTLTLALPKTGLDSVPGDLYLADIGIPPEVYRQLGLGALSPFGKDYWIQLRSVAQ